MGRSQPLHIHTQASLYWNSHITEANEPSTWNDAGSPINLSTYLYYQWDNGSFADRNSFPYHAH